MRLENLKMYLKEKITNWYRNAKIDYGTTGKFIDCVTSGNNLYIIFEEENEKLQCCVSWWQEYTTEQIYNIWMESEWEKFRLVEIA